MHYNTPLAYCCRLVGRICLLGAYYLMLALLDRVTTHLYNCVVEVDQMPVNSFENYPMSWKPTIDKNEAPLYRTLAKQLEQDIIDGMILPGTKLPPQRELADYLDVNVSTVSKALKVCALKGLLSSTIGSGTYVSYDALTNAYLLTEGNPHNLIEMGATVPESSANEIMLQILKTMVNEPTADKLFSYNRPNDTSWQKDAAVSYLKRCGYETNREHILFSSGGQNAIVALLAGVFRYGDKIGVDDHIYSGIKTAANMLGIQLVPIKAKDGAMDANALRNACKQEGLSGVYLIPDCQNPTTHTMSWSCRQEIAAVLKEQGIWLIEDATYHLMNENPMLPISSLLPEQSIYIASLSKSIAPGLRLAYMAVPLGLKSALSLALYNLNVSVSPLMAELTARLIVSGQVDRVLETHKKQTRERNRLVNKYFSPNQCIGDETSIFRWLYLPDHMSGADFEKMALQQGVQVYGAERFAVGSTVPLKAVRIAVCAPQSIGELERGLQLLQQIY